MSDYYAVIAQILPLLLLALLFEARLLQDAQRATASRWLVALFVAPPLLAFLVGEVVALEVLSDGGKGSAGAELTTKIAFAVMLGALFSQLLTHLAWGRQGRDDP